MTWNYRVRRTQQPNGAPWLEIVEAFYAEDRKTIQATTVEAMNPCGETLEELRSDLEYMLKALDHPILEATPTPHDADQPKEK